MSLLFFFGCSFESKVATHETKSITKVGLLNPINVSVDLHLKVQNGLLLKSSIMIDDDEFYGYVNEENEIIVPYKYFHLTMDTLTYYAIGLDSNFNHVGFDRDGEILYDVYIFEQGPDYPAEGLFRIEKGGKIGFASNKTGEIIIKPQFTFVEPFNEGLAVYCVECEKVKSADGEHWFMNGGKWGYVNMNGDRVFDFEFDAASTFKEGEANVEINGIQYKLNRDGNLTLTNI